MADWQQIVLVGNLGRDPELKYLQSGVPVANFSVAVNLVTGSGENRREKTIWHRVAVWREQAEIVSQYLSKGRQVLVVGTVEAHGYLDSDGQAQASLEVTAQRVIFLGGRGEEVASVAVHDQGEPLSDIPF